MKITREEMLEDVIKADTDSIYGMDAQDLWEAIYNLVAAAYENISDEELKAYHEKVFDTIEEGDDD